MTYRTLSACVADLEKSGQLLRVDHPVDPHLEVAAIQRRAFRAKAPALLFTRVKGCAFPMLANLYGTRERIHYIFRDTLPLVEHLFAVKADPAALFRKPLRSLQLPLALWRMWPRKVREGSVLDCRTSLSHLPQLVSWPRDGGAFVTLPQVYTENPEKAGFLGSNLGMYRVQISGNDYLPEGEAGLHYQIHRGIAAHHAAALRAGKALRVNVFVGGPPAMTLASIMPLPEGLPEVLFGGLLAGFRMPFVRPGQKTGDRNALPLLADADFCISATLMPGLKPEGPFGDHLGYYSLQHDFPCMRVDAVWHRKNAIWPFTSVGRPPQEDTMFGAFIHELTAELVPRVFAGVHQVHAVDAAGVHPLLLAVGSERYVPYQAQRQPRELLTCAMNVLGTGQTSLAKYVLMAAREDDAHLQVQDVPHFFRHMLERTDFSRDLHFMTSTTMDSLDYCGQALHEGSKLIWVAAGPVKRVLATEMPADLPLPAGFCQPRLAAAGIVVIQGPPHPDSLPRGAQDPAMEGLAAALAQVPGRDSIPLVVVVDDSAFAARNWENFLWITFTRSDPASDSYGAEAQTCSKHWACASPFILDARRKAFQAPPLEEDPETEARIDALGAVGGPLHGYV